MSKPIKVEVEPHYGPPFIPFYFTPDDAEPGEAFGQKTDPFLHKSFADIFAEKFSRTIQHLTDDEIMELILKADRSDPEIISTPKMRVMALYALTGELWRRREQSKA